MAVKPFKPLALLVAALFAALAVYYFFFRAEKEPDLIETTGVIEATEAAIAPKTAGRIEWACCEEGEGIEAGAVALRLDKKELEARLAEAHAAAATATAAIGEADAALKNAIEEHRSASHEVAAANFLAQKATALMNKAKYDLDRAKGLYDEGYLPQKDFDAAYAAYEATQAELSSAVYKEQSAVAKDKAAETGIFAAQARVESAKARRAEADAKVRVIEAQLEDTAIMSPLSGVVSFKAFEQGEYVSPGTEVYTVYDPTDIWARVDIEETSIQGIALGGLAEVLPSGGGASFPGKVKEIGELGGFATQRDVTRGRPDIKTFRVKVAVADPKGYLKPGMTVNVRIPFKQD